MGKHEAQVLAKFMLGDFYEEVARLHGWDKQTKEVIKLHIVDVAELCHKVNKAYCEAMGDTSQLDWDKAPEWQVQSAVNGVTFHLNHENTTPADSHNSWLKQKEAEGWKYGPVKDPVKKEHPCFVPYEQLPVEQKAKDYIFKAICEFFKPYMVNGDEQPQ